MLCMPNFEVFLFSWLSAKSITVNAALAHIPH
jgi:hypothetical protein